MRRFLWLSVGALLLASIVVASSGGATQAEARWVITDLGTFKGRETQAVGINDGGDVIGSTEVWSWNPSHAFLWSAGKMTDLGTLGGRYSGLEPTTYLYDRKSHSINDHGQIVGWAETESGKNHAFLWERGEMIDLGTLPGKQSSRALAINERGQVVGYGQMNPERAFLWEDGEMRDLGTLGGEQSSAYAINSRSQVVGESETRTGVRAFLWENGRMRNLGTLGGPSSYAVAVNDRGQVVGTAATKVFKKNQYGSRIYLTHAFLWVNGKIKDLGSLGENGGCVRYLLGCESEAVAINSRGEVVGNSVTGSIKKNGFAAHHAFLWRGGRMLDLGTLGGAESRAVAINNQGQVVGYAETKVGLKGTNSLLHHAFAWVDGKMRDLGTLPGGKQSEALAVNSRGQVVGWSNAKDGKRHAVLWTLKR